MSDLFEARVEAAAEVLLRDYQSEYDGGEVSEFLDVARAVLEAADAVAKRVDEDGNEHQKCLGCGRYLDECCLTLDERMARARAKGFEFVKEADAVVTEEMIAEALYEALYEAFQDWDDEVDDLFAVQAKAVVSLFRGGAK